MISSSYTILHADDDVDDLLLVSELFHKHVDRVTIQHVSDGMQALHTLERMRQSNSLPCLIILDINMPMLNGKETLLHIKASEALKDIPVILFTTSNTETDKAFARKYEADLITKPVTIEAMKNVVNEFVRRCQLEAVRRAC
ncbi:MAG TPA: response regulator [Flavisolibacter sp.]|jgi:CheY-like chemotaxis protein|nr:response regulator [Flavisolibacter sp.]